MKSTYRATEGQKLAQELEGGRDAHAVEYPLVRRPHAGNLGQRLLHLSRDEGGDRVVRRAGCGGLVGGGHLGCC